ncbi:MAG: hypothetical protein HYY17_04495 [Planctomycetes bacterium]|nr:hypothetical protein [Planctomycetota bacterium]
MTEGILFAIVFLVVLVFMVGTSAVKGRHRRRRRTRHHRSLVAGHRRA